MKKKNINEDVEIGDIQYQRIWIHNIKLGYGNWILSSKLAELVKEKNQKLVMQVKDEKRDFLVSATSLYVNGIISMSQRDELFDTINSKFLEPTPTCRHCKIRKCQSVACSGGLPRIYNPNHYCKVCYKYLISQNDG